MLTFNIFNFLLTTPTILFKLDKVLNTVGIEMARRINLPLSVYLIIEMARGVTSRYLFI
jgi:hypothetical protein